MAQSTFGGIKNPVVNNVANDMLGPFNQLGSLPGLNIPQPQFMGNPSSAFGDFSNPMSPNFYSQNAHTTQFGGAGAGNFNPAGGNIIVSPQTQGIASPMSAPMQASAGMGVGVQAPQAQSNAFDNWNTDKVFGQSTDSFMNQGLKSPDTFLGMGAQGWGNVIGGVNALGNMFLGYKAYSENKKNNAFNRKMATNNFNAQAQTYNTNSTRRARSNAQSLGLEGDERNDFISSREKEEHIAKM